MELHYIPLIVLVFMLCYLQNGLALKCYFCMVSGPSPDQNCNGTLKDCTSNEPFCITRTLKDNRNTSFFKRDCATSIVCEPNYCKDEMIDSPLGYTECSISCCKDDFCNRGVINSSGGTLSIMRGLQIALAVVIPWYIYVS